MARVGRYGRQPRGAPDLSASIVALIREYENQREANIINAWSEGGDFEGHAVTDEMLVKFFNDKVKGLDPRDPLYDEARNTRDQYVFAVKNSQHELSYANGKTSNSQMAAFYIAEAGRHPRNSEVWRQMMKLAASYHERATTEAAGSAAQRAARKAALVAAVDVTARGEVAYDVMTGALLDIARQRGILNSATGMTSESGGENFGDLQLWQGDFSAMTQLINEFSGPEFAQYRATLTAYIRKHGDPDFDGNFSIVGFAHARDNKLAALTGRLGLARAQGTKTQQKAIAGQIGETTKAGAALAVIDPLARHEEDRAVLQQVLDDPSSTPIDISYALGVYTKQTQAIAAEVNQQAVSQMRPDGTSADGGRTSVLAGRFNNELRYLAGDTSGSIGETPFGETRPQATGTGAGPTAGSAGSTVNTDGMFIANVAQQASEDMLNLQTGKYVIARVGSDGLFTTNPAGDWGVVLATDVANVPNAVLVAAEDGAAMQVVVGVPVIAHQGGTPDLMGRATTDLDPARGTLRDIGAKFTNPDGSVFYKFYDANNEVRYSAGASPFLGYETTTKDGVMLVGPTVAGVVQTFDPISLTNPLYREPQANSAMERTVFSSPYIASRAAMGPDVLASTSPAELSAAVSFEAGGDPARETALFAEFDRVVAAESAARLARLPNIARPESPYAGRSIAPYVSDIVRTSGAGEFDQNPDAQYVSEAEYRRRAVALVQAAHPTEATMAATRAVPAKELAAYVQRMTGRAMTEVMGPAPAGYAATLAAALAARHDDRRGYGYQDPAAIPAPASTAPPSRGPSIVEAYNQSPLMMPPPAPPVSMMPPPPAPPTAMPTAGALYAQGLGPPPPPDYASTAMPSYGAAYAQGLKPPPPKKLHK